MVETVENFILYQYYQLRRELEEIYGVRKPKKSRRKTGDNKKRTRAEIEELKEDIFNEMEKLWYKMTDEEQKAICSYVPPYLKAS